MRKAAFILVVLLALVAGACQPKVERPTPDATTAAPMSGKDLYEYRCAFCHGISGAGDAPTASGYPNANLADGTWAYGQSPEEIARSIAQGIPGTPMRGFADAMSKEDIDKVTEYVISLAKK